MKNNPASKTIKEKTETHKPSGKKVQKINKELFEMTESFFSRNGQVFLWISMAITLLVSILLFDIKVSDGGDDSAYIVRAYNFIHGFEFPGGFQGPLYPIVLSIFIKIMGINIPFLKVLSIIFMLIFTFLFHKSYSKYIPATLLYPTMLLISINSYLLYFASQTYSEAFFMMNQAILFIVVFKYFIFNETEEINIKHDYKKFLLLGFILFIVSTSKNIGYASIVAVLFYFIIEKRWKTLLFSFLGTSIFVFIFEIIKRIIWNSWEIQLESQGTGLTYTDFYNPSKGTDGFGEFIQRFIDNSNLYLSKHLYLFLGFKSQFTITPVLTLLTYGIFLIALIFVFKKNKFLLFTGTYIGLLCAVTFVILQKQWDQGRLLVIYYPYILLFIFGGFYYILKKENFKKLQILLIVLFPVIFITTLSSTTPVIHDKKAILKKNLEGDILYGLTQDWVNFIKMSKWAAENIPQDKIIASRKPDISFVYTERKFYPVFKVPTITLKELNKKLNNDTLPVSVAVNLADIQKKPDLYANYRYYIRAFVPGGLEGKTDSAANTFNYVIYSFNETNSSEFLKKLEENKIQYHRNISAYLDQLKKEKYSYMIYDPDIVLNQLKKNNVSYFILAKLRRTTVKSKLYIDTMERLLYYVELKYPIFVEIKKIGTEEDARLLEAHYEMLTGDKSVIRGISNRNANTPDIINYVEVCKWAAANLPKNSKIASIDLGNIIKNTGCNFYILTNVPTSSNEDISNKINKDSLPVSVAVILSDVYNNKNMGQFFNGYRFYIKAFVMGNKSEAGQQTKKDFTYVIYSFSNKLSPAIFKLFDDKKVRYIKNAPLFLASLKNEQTYYNIYDPDVLLRKIKSENINYFIAGNVRLNPMLKGQINQTMNYLLYFLELKYPVIKEIHKFGQEEEAKVLEIQYDKLNKKLVKF